jgi:hypothetical protein
VSVQGFLSQGVEVAGECIRFDLAVPGLSIKLAKPFTKFGELLSRQCTNLVFELFKPLQPELLLVNRNRKYISARGRWLRAQRSESQRSEGVTHLGAVYGDLGDPLRLLVPGVRV